MSIRKGNKAKTFYVATLKEVCEYLPFSLPILNKAKQHTSFPDKDNAGYDVLKIWTWYVANPGLGRGDKLAEWRDPSLQLKGDKVGEAAADLKTEQAAWTRLKKERESIRLQIDRAEVVSAADRDDEEHERYSIIKGRLYEAGRTSAPELLKASTVEQASNAFEDALDDAFERIRLDFENLNGRPRRLQELAGEDVDEDSTETD